MEKKIEKTEEGVPVTQGAAVADPAVAAEMDESTAVATRGSLDLDRPRGEDEDVQIAVPYLGICYGVGGLADTGNFKSGDLVLGKEDLICSVGEHINMIIFDYALYWKEYAYTEGVMPQKFNTRAEAHAAGFTTERDPVTGALPTASPAYLWWMLIEKPDDVESQFFIADLFGKKWALAKFAVEKSGFIAVKQPFGFAVKLNVKAAGEENPNKRGIHVVKWDMSIAQRQAKTTKNKTWVPNIKTPGNLTPEEETELRAVLAGLVG